MQRGFIYAQSIQLAVAALDALRGDSEVTSKLTGRKECGRLVMSAMGVQWA